MTVLTMQSAPAPPLRILVADDSRIDAELAIDVLTKSGMSVRADVVSTRADFTHRINSGSYDLVLADYRMPGWTGLDALDEIKALGSDTPVILLTGTLGDEAAVEYVKRGVTDYVLKENLTRLPFVAQRAIRDVRAERARKQVEVRFIQLAENISEVFFVMDADYRETLYINPAYERIWGRSRGSLYENTRSFLEPFVEGDRERVIEYIGKVRSGESAGDIEACLVLPDGERRWILGRAIPIRNDRGEIYRIGGVALDITERHAAAERLQDSEERFRKITEASLDGFTLSVDGRIRDANRGFAEIFGYTMDEVIFRSMFDFVAEESLEEVKRRVEQGDETTYEMVGKRKDGSKILLEVTGRSHSVGGRPGRISALRDITEKRSLEAQFHQAQKMEAVGRLAAGVAHDFNNLLTVITSYASMLSDELETSDPHREDVQAILKASGDAASLTRQLLAFTRQQAIAPRLVVLEETVAVTKKMLSRLIGADIDLAMSLSAETSQIMIDPGQLEQVMMNLVVNARDAMPTGGTLTIETRVAERTAGTIEPQWSALPGKYAVLVVRDTGVGMGTQTKARAFEPFFTTKPLGKGTGLGLSTAYGVVRQSGGFIEVDSEVGRGTEFRIYLPISAAEVASSHTPADAPESLEGSETILLVEDSPLVRAAMSDVLERFGYRVLASETSIEALELVVTGEVEFDLLITDLVMPGISGSLLAEEMKHIRPKTPILFISGYTDEVTLRHGITEPGVPYMQKPFTSEQLVRKVREVLS